MRKNPVVRYHQTDTSTHLIAQFPVSVADAERGLRASATQRIYGGPNVVGNVLIPARGRFSLEDPTLLREHATTRRHGGDLGAAGTAYRDLMERSPEPGERQFGLAPWSAATLEVAPTALAYWQTDSYSVNGKPATISSNFVLSLRPMGPRKTELGVYQVRVRLFTGRQFMMNIHTFSPYVGCREQPGDHVVEGDLEAVMQWARDAIYGAPPAGEK
jgi:hypothetical protein